MHEVVHVRSIFPIFTVGSPLCTSYWFTIFFRKTPHDACNNTTTPAQERLKAVCKPTVHEMMFFMNAWALGFLSVASLFSGQWADGFAFLAENPLAAVRERERDAERETSRENMVSTHRAGSCPTGTYMYVPGTGGCYVVNV